MTNISFDKQNMINQNLTQAKALTTLLQDYSQECGGDFSLKNHLICDVLWTIETLIGNAQSAMEG
ncbi:hypothetical protein [Testudinibacter aquarius]|uniref:Uncharacterized protein n=1 Tax=Testudinibacter aquarius TaxID=1524974 RepID=A0A4R3Y4M3_9PAST|nr:hypothetical protein [Testudinibacter aquarius]KAE9528055.1 hypothetical protein A1D24_01450 [Testudinibacter aquarius]TCV86512.1 hypothetical protein EDC16_10666 [Testudinibacter aquarius]TNG92641.1 hypothetical protein FHQ21_03850 [Testudinibacter aquarius]